MVLGGSPLGRRRGARPPSLQAAAAPSASCMTLGLRRQACGPVDFTWGARPRGYAAASTGHGPMPPPLETRARPRGRR
jgi:hypothetical protein